MAEALAKNLRGGEVIEMIGDLGAGKTTFVSGLVRALGYTGPVTSPTFSLLNVYKTDALINHFDLYRLEDIGEVKHEIDEAMSQPHAITIIEWAKQIEYIEDLIKIQLESQPEENKRKITISVPSKYSYAIEGLA